MYKKTVQMCEEIKGCCERDEEMSVDTKILPITLEIR